MSERIGLWGLRLLALLLAIALWFWAAVESRERQLERVVDVAVTYDAPRGLIVLNPVQSVKVRLRGSESRLRTLNVGSLDVVARPPGGELGLVEFHLGPEDVARPADLEVVSIEPNSLRLQIDREASRLVPVRVRLTGEPAAGSVPESAQPVPEAVLVTGPESRLRGLTVLSTGPVSLDGHALDFEEATIVVSPDPLVRVVDPSVVTVRVQLAQPGETRRRSE